MMSTVERELRIGDVIIRKSDGQRMTIDFYSREAGLYFSSWYYRSTRQQDYLKAEDVEKAY